MVLNTALSGSAKQACHLHADSPCGKASLFRCSPWRPRRRQGRVAALGDERGVHSKRAEKLEQHQVGAASLRDLVDKDLYDVLELATDEELEDIYSMLFGMWHSLSSGDLHAHAEQPGLETRPGAVTPCRQQFTQPPFEEHCWREG
jgi:hypothetical protein